MLNYKIYLSILIVSVYSPYRAESLGNKNPDIDYEDVSVEALKVNQIKHATIKGKILKYGDLNIYAFQGIPYATANRFENPTVINHYSNKEEFITLPAPCLQMARSGIPTVIGTENCLQLNVYTPASISNDTFESEDLPVMVYLHGGYFVSGDTSLAMPTRLAKEGVILVTVQYRLGPLGFFLYKNQTYNQAIQDQRIALEWINKNIEDFGGSKDKVTLIGEGAGAISALYLLWKEENDDDASKYITGGIIAHSGSPLQPFTYDNNPGILTKEIITAVNCKDMFDLMCLKKETSSSDYILAFNNILKTRSVMFPFMAPGKDDEFTETPFEMFSNGFKTNTAVVIGTTEQEGFTTFGAFSFTYLYPNKLDKDADYLENEAVEDFLSLAGISDDNEFVDFAVKNAFSYEASQYTMENVAPSFIDMTGSLLVKSPVYEMAKLLSDENEVYLYSFQHTGKRSNFAAEFWKYDTEKYYTDTSRYSGAAKGDDLLYFLNFPNMINQDDKKVEENIVSMWTTFAKNGKLPTKWKKFNTESKQYFVIGVDPYNKSDYESTFTLNIDKDPDETTTTGSTSTRTTTTGSTSTKTTTTGSTSTRTTPTKDSSEDVTFTDSSTTSSKPTRSTTTEKPKNCSKIEDERRAYLITMIIFILLFVAALIAAIYFGCKKN